MWIVQKKSGPGNLCKKVKTISANFLFALTLLHLLVLADAEPRDDADVPLETTWRGFTKLQKRGSHFGRVAGDQSIEFQL